MADERRDLHGACRDEVEKRGEVAVLGPSDVADRVVAPFQLVRGIITAGTVRS